MPTLIAIARSPVLHVSIRFLTVYTCDGHNILNKQPESLSYKESSNNVMQGSETFWNDFRHSPELPC